MSLDLSGILDAIEIIADDRVNKAGYDKTVVAAVVHCDDPDRNLYTVLYQDSVFTKVSSYNNEVYQENDLVYLTIPSNNSSAKKYIVGRVSNEVQDAVDASRTELDNYRSLGVLNLAYKTPEDGTIFGANIANDKKVRVYPEGDTDLDYITETLRAAFLVSPYFVFEYDIKNEIQKGYLSTGNFGFIITLKFKRPEFAVSEGEFYTKEYTIDINKMSGQPYLYKAGSHQHTIFKIENAKYFDSVESIYFFAQNFESGDKFWVSNMKFYGATKKGEELNRYQLEIAADAGQNSIKQDPALPQSAKTALSASLKIGDVELVSNQVKYYWLREDLQVRADVSTAPSSGYLRLAGDGWYCLNETRDLEPLDNITVKNFVSGTSSIVLDGNNLPIYRNRIKCIAVYFDKIIESNIIEILNRDKPNYNFHLVSYIRPASSQEIDYTTWNKNTALQWVDYAAIVCETESKEVNNNLFYLWQTIDSGDQRKYLSGNSVAQYIHGYEIEDKITYKCGVSIGDEYIDTVEVTLTNIDNEMRNNFSFKSNIFNALTNNGANDGIYFADKDGNPLKTSEAIDRQKDAQLYINATWIKSGHLEVSDKENGRTIFKADIDKPEDTQIGGFTVTDRALYNGIFGEESISELTGDTKGNGVYLGIDGLFIGEKQLSDNGNYIKVYEENKTDADGKQIKEWILEIKGRVIATSGKIGGFSLQENILYSGEEQNKSLFGIDTNEYNPNAVTEKEKHLHGIWLGKKKNASTYGFDNAAFSVDKLGSIYAESGRIGGFNFYENWYNSNFQIFKLSKSLDFFDKPAPGATGSPSNMTMHYDISGYLGKDKYQVVIQDCFCSNPTITLTPAASTLEINADMIQIEPLRLDFYLDGGYIKQFNWYVGSTADLLHTCSYIDFCDSVVLDSSGLIQYANKLYGKSNSTSDLLVISVYNNELNPDRVSLETYEAIKKGSISGPFRTRTSSSHDIFTYINTKNWKSLNNFSFYSSGSYIFAITGFRKARRNPYQSVVDPNTLQTDYIYIDYNTLHLTGFPLGVYSRGLLSYNKNFYDDLNTGIYMSPSGIGIGNGYYLNSEGVLRIKDLGLETDAIENIYTKNIYLKGKSLEDRLAAIEAKI